MINLKKNFQNQQKNQKSKKNKKNMKKKPNKLKNKLKNSFPKIVLLKKIKIVQIIIYKNNIIFI